MKKPTNSENKPNILSIRMESSGAWVTVQCRRCGHPFETFVVTIGGIAFIQARCAGCGVLTEIWPEDYGDALDRLLPQKPTKNPGKLQSEATRITENWYRCAPLKELLEFRGVNLGLGAERDLMSIVVQGLMEAKEIDNGP